MRGSKPFAASVPPRNLKRKVRRHLGWTVKECQYFVATDARGVKAIRECSSLTLRSPGRGRWYDMQYQGISARQIVHLLGSPALGAGEADGLRETSGVRRPSS